LIVNTVKITCIIVVIALAVTLILASSLEPIFAQKKGKDTDNKEKNVDKEKLTLEVKIFLQDLERTGFLRITALFNGEGITKDIPFSEIDPAQNTIKVDLKADKQNDIVKASTGDEYLACVYHVKDLLTEFNDFTNFDCNEGDMESSSGVTTVSLFKPSSLVFKDSLAFHNSQTTQVNQTGINSNKSTNNEKAIVKIYSPLSDAKDTKKLKIMVMLKGQIQSAVIDDVQEELDKISGDTITRTFTFDRKTDIGLIHLGDKFLACVASDDLRPPEGQECEKRVLKKFGKPNDLYAR
jgi:hypothetical protein